MFRSPQSASKADTSQSERNKNRVPFLLKNDDSTSAFCTPGRRMTRAMAKHPVEKSSSKRSEATKSTKKKLLKQEAVDDETPIVIDATANNGNLNAHTAQLQIKAIGSKRKSKASLNKANEVDAKVDSTSPINKSGRFVRALDNSMDDLNDGETPIGIDATVSILNAQPAQLQVKASGSKRKSKASLNKANEVDLHEMDEKEDSTAPHNTSGRFVRSNEKSMDEPNELNTTFDAPKEETDTINKKGVIDLTESPMPLEVTKLNETFDAEKDDTFTKEKDNTFTKIAENDDENKEMVVKTPNASNRNKTLTPKTEPAKANGNKASGKKSNLSKLSHTIGSARTKATGNKLSNPTKLKGIQLAKVIETAKSLAENTDSSTDTNIAKVSDSELRSQIQQGFAMYNERKQRGQTASSSVTKSKIKNVPNFKGMHERQFAKSASIDQHQKDIEERAKLLSVGKKVENKENFPKPSDVKSRRKLDMIDTNAKTATLKPKEISKESSVRGKIPILNTKPKQQPKDDKVFIFSAAPINKEEVVGSKVDKKANQRRRESGSEREQRRMAMFKKSNAQKPKVRTNRRFELLMKFRNK